VIDASVFVGAERGDCDLWGRLERSPGEEVAMAAISASELLHRVHRAGAAQRPKREAFVENILSTVTILPFDMRVARVHARLWADLATRGTAVGERDLFIAATAVGYGHRVITRDLRTFPKMPGVDVEVWGGTDKEKIATRRLLQEAIGQRCRLRWQGRAHDVVVTEAMANHVTVREGTHNNIVMKYEDVSGIRFRD
jgi:predicted nucleic acid-binding protein